MVDKNEEKIKDKVL